ncbi:hypothetical protein [Fictibacillus barbaricus]|uniref:Uncharacterized protein n=1 Tax=Fictibacillus barbaricus TaxID=182136 RepID=A0ABU1TWB3_9BACL|nr:hypothetical protein [Fictibacillus barbaricus]MDR7071488.1 hypothetical protein [Fictibacillus barbaricus]
MKKYEAKFDKNEIDLLKNMIGKQMTSIFGSSITSHDHGDLTPYQSYATVFLTNEQKEILAFSCRVLETQHNEEYWKISIQKQENPAPFIFEVDDEDKKVNLTNTEILIESHVMGMSIFSKEFETDMEQLNYDHAVVFELENGRNLCISAMNGPCGVDITMDEEEIQKILAGCIERFV